VLLGRDGALLAEGDLGPVLLRDHRPGEPAHVQREVWTRRRNTLIETVPASITLSRCSGRVSSRGNELLEKKRDSGLFFLSRLVSVLVSAKSM
jgi:hypothetical protein